MNKRRNIVIVLLLSIFMVGLAPKIVQAYTTTYTRVEITTHKLENGEQLNSSTSWYKDGKPVSDPTGWYCRPQSEERISKTISNPWLDYDSNEQLVHVITRYSVTFQCKD